MSSAVLADGSYYTWVDAQGRIHNEPIAPDEDSQEKPLDSPPGDDAEYLTEEQVDEKIRKFDEDNPAFYVWVEADGTTHTETYDAESEQEAAESAGAVSDAGAVIGWDPMLAPPFRVSEKIHTGACCEAFRDQFVEVPEQFKSVQLFDPVRYRSFPTAVGDHSAWYFETGIAPKKSSGQRFLVLRLRGAPVEASFIALDAAYKPLYFSGDLPMEETPESWHSVGYQEARILIEDAEVAAFILYLDVNPAEDVSLEIRWADGYTPFQ